MASLVHVFLLFITWIVPNGSAHLLPLHASRRRLPRTFNTEAQGYLLAPMPVSTTTCVDVSKSPQTHLPSTPQIRHFKCSEAVRPECTTVHCEGPYTQTALGSPCGCVIPMQVALKVDMALFSLFRAISMLAEEIAWGTTLLQNQVRISGVISDNEDQSKSIVEINLLPFGQDFDNLTSVLIFQRFIDHKVPINESIFGKYTVLYIHYPGLPVSLPFANMSDTASGELPLLPTEQPLGVDLAKRDRRMNTSSTALIVLSCVIGAAILLGGCFMLFVKFRSPACASLQELCIHKGLEEELFTVNTDIDSPVSGSSASSMVTCTMSARTFSLQELKRATNQFSPQKVIGEGGFGRVFGGILEDGTKVAVKLLTRVDQRRNDEFSAEVKMLSRLHHRNLVKLIGVCTEGHSRCLVYELIPNGSVELHLHGTDRVAAPLSWDARMKIALGAARGLAYLHEDANPRVIHRDFKASNILLETDFTPKISDFGLAKAALDAESGRISTRVMGTFGYVAPEYAMTGYLLVKSDVYSYGVVLLELLSGRKAIDLSQSPTKGSLVNWARPLLSTREGLETLADPILQSAFSFDDFAKVAAIASMCVQPEVSHRPFMGEVVQALKLVWNDCGELCSITVSPEDSGGGRASHPPWVGSEIQNEADGTSFISVDYDSGTIHQNNGIKSQKEADGSLLLSVHHESANSQQNVRGVGIGLGCADARSFHCGDFDRRLPKHFRRHSISHPLNSFRTDFNGEAEKGFICRSMSDPAQAKYLG